MELTGLSYTQILLYASLPLSVIMWLVTYFFVKKTLPKTIKLHPYSKEDIAIAEDSKSKSHSSVVKQATIAFFVSLIGLIIYGLVTGGGSTFAIIVILVTAIVTGLVGRLKPNELMETFFEGAKPLIWLFFLFILFTPFINYVEQLGGFQAIANLLEPLVDMGGNALLVIVSTIIGVAGIPGAAVAQAQVLAEMFGAMFTAAGIPIGLYTLFLVVGSQMTDLLYPIGDTLGAMGVARSKDLKSMVIFGIIATLFIILYLVIVSLIFL
jgi:Na+/H+ antiporter NhaC